MSSKRKISIYGATGSIGQSSADVILANPDLFDVHVVTAHNNVALLAETAIKLNADIAIIGSADKEDALISALHGHDIRVLSGVAAINESARAKVDLVMAAIMGFAGLRPIVNALQNGVNVAIANKEPLVAAGEYIVRLAKNSGAKVLPVDSEHNAVFQVFENHNKISIDKIILTASGGPFLDKSLADVQNATKEQALKHPNWVMGQKISIDSATMMNKALEIIEAKYLFDLPPEKIDVVIHPQSVIHSMVQYNDGSVLSQMGASDMRTPIAYTLGWPARINSGGEKLDIHSLSQLDFKVADFERFTALKYAYKCLEIGQGACITLNAANEIAVAHFLDGSIKFGKIMDINAYSIETIYPKVANYPLKTLEDVENMDNTVRLFVTQYIKSQ
ncbi:MAG: 1-deoxy-D-xylulose-5-phosphate reductoisomerase [Alphaproteobacteria bacterium]